MRPRNVMIGGGWEPLAVFITHSESVLLGQGLFCYNALLVRTDNAEDIWHVLEWKSRMLPGGVCTVCVLWTWASLNPVDTLSLTWESENQAVINDRKQFCRSETARPWTFPPLQLVSSSTSCHKKYTWINLLYVINLFLFPNIHTDSLCIECCKQRGYIDESLCVWSESVRVVCAQYWRVCVESDSLSPAWSANLAWNERLTSAEEGISASTLSSQYYAGFQWPLYFTLFMSSRCVIQSCSDISAPLCHQMELQKIVFEHVSRTLLPICHSLVKELPRPLMSSVELVEKLQSIQVSPLYRHLC